MHPNGFQARTSKFENNVSYLGDKFYFLYYRQLVIAKKILHYPNSIEFR